MLSDNNETKICKECGRELPLNKFKKYTRNGKTRLTDTCKECFYDKITAAEQQKFLQEYLISNKYRVKRKYKHPHISRILDTKKIGIDLTGKNEVFVKLLDYKNAWISNYGRLLMYYNGNYFMRQKKYNDDGEIVYALEKNVYDGERWLYAKVTVPAWELVTKEFIVNYDMTNNVCCWHKGGKKSDNYFKHIYPVNKKQYQAIENHFEKTGDDSQKMIFEIMNNIQYKPDGWKVIQEKRTFCKKGYVGCDLVLSDRESGNYEIYLKWRNMIQRCYCKAVHKTRPYYKGCTVCEEWFNFANFRKWFIENNMFGKKVDLDKDILVQGSTVYSPETCSLVPHFTNTVFEERGNKNCIVKKIKTGTFDAVMSVLGKVEPIGSFATEEEATAAYVNYKGDYIVDLAKKSKGKVPDKVYDAMMRWKVEVNY